MESIYCNYVKCLEDLEELLNKEEFSFVRHAFIFGSLARKRIHEESDIDLLLIGDKEKTIDLVNFITSSVDRCLRIYKDVDVKYYQIDEFRKLRATNRFLVEIEKDCKTIGGFL